MQLIADNERGKIDTRGCTKHSNISLGVRAKIYCVLITLRTAPLSDCSGQCSALLFSAINRRKICVKPIIDCYKRVLFPRALGVASTTNAELISSFIYSDVHYSELTNVISCFTLTIGSSALRKITNNFWTYSISSNDIIINIYVNIYH